jgi:hypothetical protein
MLFNYLAYAMNELENNCETSAETAGLSLYTALSIFTARAPKIINSIAEAAKKENLAQMEELAAKLIAYSNQAQLDGFTDKAKDLVIAAREHKISTLENQVDLLKQHFEQMVKASPGMNNS